MHSMKIILNVGVEVMKITAIINDQYVKNAIHTRLVKLQGIYKTFYYREMVLK